MGTVRTALPEAGQRLACSPLVKTSSVRLIVAAAALVTVTACSSEPELVDAQRDCTPLLKGRGFAGFALVDQEPLGSGLSRFRCVFVSTGDLSARPQSDVPTRNVTYETNKDSFTEEKGTAAVQQSWSGAPRAE